MFSGIVEKVAKVYTLKDCKSYKKLFLELPPSFFKTLKTGSSLAINGVCLTFLGAKEKNIAVFDVVLETLQKTNLGDLKKGDFVNIERSLKLGDEVGGHFLSGHVLETTFFLEKKESYYFFSTNEKTAFYILEKGFIALDGVSLTIASVEQNKFSVALIPHTLKSTTFAFLEKGKKINIEIDFQTKAIVDTVKNCIQLKKL